MIDMPSNQTKQEQYHGCKVSKSDKFGFILKDIYLSLSLSLPLSFTHTLSLSLSKFTFNDLDKNGAFFFMDGTIPK